MRDEEAVDDVEVRRRTPVHPRDRAVVDAELGHRVVRPVGRHEAQLGQRRDELLEVELAAVARLEAAATHEPAVLAPCTPSAASRTNAPVRFAP